MSEIFIVMIQIFSTPQKVKNLSIYISVRDFHSLVKITRFSVIRDFHSLVKITQKVKNLPIYISDVSPVWLQGEETIVDGPTFCPSSMVKCIN